MIKGKLLKCIDKLLYIVVGQFLILENIHDSLNLYPILAPPSQ